jgi:hypothetical protein
MKIFPKNLATKLPAEFADNINAMSAEEINDRILEAEGNIYKVEDDLSSNEKILDAKAELKEMTGPYRDTKKQEAAKIKYCLWVLEERGLEIGKEQE